MTKAEYNKQYYKANKSEIRSKYHRYYERNRQELLNTRKVKRAIAAKARQQELDDMFQYPFDL